MVTGTTTTTMATAKVLTRVKSTNNGMRVAKINYFCPNL